MIKKIIYIVLTIFLLFCTFTGGYLYRVKEEADENKIIKLDEDYLWKSVNEWRVKSNLVIYQQNKDVCDMADIRLKETSKVFSHRGFIEISEKYKNKFSRVAENLAEYSVGDSSVLEGWLNSPTHAANLKADYQYSCIRCSGNVCVEMFANY